MFCSKCGKTIHAEDNICPNCQAPIGDNRFGGIPYTSVQFTIAPGQKTFEALNNYTRTTYTSMDNATQEGGEVDSRTTYRPVYEGASAPEDVRRDMRAAVSGEEEDTQEEADETPAFVPGVPLSPSAKATLSELDEELRPEEEIDRSQFKSRPIQSSGRAGISQDVSDYIRKLEDNQNRRGAARRRAAAPVYDDYADVDADEDSFDPEAQSFDDEPDVFDDIDDEEFDELRYGSRFGVGQIIKIIIALALVAALVFGGIYMVNRVRSSQSSAPIEGVSETLYEEGIALVKSHMSDEYILAMITKYTEDGVLSMSTSLEEGRAAIDALMPAEPAANDETFIDALQAIQDNIVSAITMDALSASDTSATALEDSKNRWAIVENSIVQLESARSAAELTAVINGQTITVQSQTPAPTEAPIVYTPLSKGDESNEVMKLQVRLYNLGYLTDNRDGVYGSKTQTAIKLFQETAGLPATGIADSETQTRLYADDAPYAPGAATPTPAPTVQPTPNPTLQAEAPAEEAGAPAGENAA